MNAEFDAAVASVQRAAGIDRTRAEAVVRANATTLGVSAPNAAIAQQTRDMRSEKGIEAAGDRLMQEHGFEVIRFSHPGKTRQTEGIPDRRYYRRPRAPHAGGPWTATNMRAEALVVWVEYKSANGHQRPGQKLFQELAEACGEPYVLGGIAELSAWLAQHEKP